jgi:hypothetical protein
VVLLNPNGSRLGRVREFTQIFPAFHEGRILEKINQRETGTEVMRRLPDQSLKLVRLSEKQAKSFNLLVSSNRHSKNVKTTGAWT